MVIRTRKFPRHPTEIFNILTDFPFHVFYFNPARISLQSKWPMFISTWIFSEDKQKSEYFESIDGYEVGQHFCWKNSILNGEWDWGEPRLVWIFRIQVNHHCELWDLRRLSFKISSGPLKKLKRIEKRFLIVKNIRFALPRCTFIIWAVNSNVRYKTYSNQLKLCYDKLWKSWTAQIWDKEDLRFGFLTCSDLTTGSLETPK